MALHFGDVACGGDQGWIDTPARREGRRRGGDACFAIAGCPAPDPPWTAEAPPCPPLPVQTVEDIVREARHLPAELDLIVTGKLVVATGRWWPRTLSGHPTPCDQNTLWLALESTIQGACYAIGINPKLQCAVDSSRLCCDHLPLGAEAAMAGHLSHDPNRNDFYFVFDGRVCRLPPGAPPVTSSPSSAAPAPPPR